MNNQLAALYLIHSCSISKNNLLIHAAIECHPLLSIANGIITYTPDNTSNYVLGTVATYSCNAGYVLALSVGSETRTCMENDNVDVIGDFDGQAPTCIGKLNVQEHMHGVWFMSPLRGV